MARKQYHELKGLQYDAETLEYMAARTRSNLVWQSLYELKGIIDGSIPSFRKVKSITSGQRRALRAEGIISYRHGVGSCRLFVTELGRALIAQEDARVEVS